MRVSDIMTKGVETISADTTILQAARKMSSRDIGVIPVMRGEKLVGIITDRDIVLRGVARDFDCATATVSECMSTDVFTCSENESLEQACRTMEDRQIHRLIATDSANKPVGILSISDLAVKAHNEHLTWEVVERICEPLSSRR
jgi:CBS domain-containing protein